MADWIDLPEDRQAMIIGRLEMRDIVNMRVLNQPSRQWLRQTPPVHQRIHYRSMTFERIEDTIYRQAHVKFVALDFDNNGITGKIPLPTLGNIGRIVISRLFDTTSIVDEMTCMKMRDTESFDLNRGVFIGVKSLLLVCCSMVANKSIWSRCQTRVLNKFQLLLRNREMFDLENFGFDRIENIRQWNVLLPHDPAFIVMLIDEWIYQDVPIGMFAQSWVQHFRNGIGSMIRERFTGSMIYKVGLQGECIRVSNLKMIVVRSVRQETDNNPNNYTNDPYDVLVAKMVAFETSGDECTNQTQIDYDLVCPRDFPF